MDIKKVIAIRKDWPKKGISFKDIMPLLGNYQAFNEAVNQMAEPFKKMKITKVICADARGFFFGAPIAIKLKAGLVGARKPGKLPYVGAHVEYDLEYGKNALEAPKGVLKPSDRVLIVDDLLATGGSAAAMTALVKKSKAKLVGYSFLIELTDLNGRKKLAPIKTASLVKYKI